MKLQALSILAMLALTACAGRGAINLSPLTSGPSATFNLVDQRPEDEKIRKGVANNPANPLSQIVYINHGDQNFQPDRLTLLRQTLARKAGQPLMGKQLILLHFTVREYPRGSIAQSRAAASAAVSPVLPSLLESGDQTDTVEVEITLSLDGRHYAAQTRMSYRLGTVWSASYESSAFQTATRKATETAINDVADKIARSTGSQPH